jgi:trk system potassium uptake protein TrkH
MQWYGGLGIVVLSLALLFRPGSTAKRFAVTETDPDDLVGGTKAYARRVLAVYVILTGAGILLLLALRVRSFDALLYTMASVSTGGFAPHDNSLAALGSPAVYYAVVLICLSAAVPLTLYRWPYKRGRRSATAGMQLRGLLIMGALVTVTLAFSLALTKKWQWGEAILHAPILAFSAQTTAGFSSTDLSSLQAAPKLVLIIAMAVGGGVGSTAGGIKILRLLMVISILGVLLRRTCTSKHAVAEPRMAGQAVDEKEIQEAFLIIFLFIATIFISWLPFLFLAYDPLDSLFEVVSATGTVGLSIGVVSRDMPGLLKGVLCVDMLLGRLEILAWVVMLYPKTWFGRRLGES